MFKFLCFKIFLVFSTQNWPESKRFCENKGLKLITLRKNAENNFQRESYRRTGYMIGSKYGCKYTTEMHGFAFKCLIYHMNIAKV